MPIRAVVYVSEASDALRGDLLGLRSGKLRELVDDATRFNRDAGVSGVLLFDGTRFVQYLEGPGRVGRGVLKGARCFEPSRPDRAAKRDDHGSPLALLAYALVACGS